MRFKSNSCLWNRQIIGLRQETKVLGKKEMIFKFIRRPTRDLEETVKFRIPNTSATLSYIGWNGRTTTPDLAREPK